VDTFDRPDSTELGNGWTEKYSPAFAIQNNEVVMTDTGTIDYHDAIAYRPVSEDRRDVEVGLEFRVLSDLTFPQVHARMQRDTIGQANTLDDYMFFVDGEAASPGRAVIARQAPEPGQFQCHMLGIPFPSPLQPGERYRVRLRVVGDYPVTLAGFVDRFDGVLSNFSGLNCVQHLPAVARTLADLVKPRGAAVLCLSTRVCLWEIAWYGLRGNLKKAFRRLPGATVATLNGIPVPVWYPTIASVRRAFSPSFRLRSIRAVGLFVPPSYAEPWIERHQQALKSFEALDRVFGTWPGFRGVGDHVLLQFERTSELRHRSKTLRFTALLDRVPARPI